VNRRSFVGTLELGLFAAPLAAAPQLAKRVYKIGYLGAGTSEAGPGNCAKVSSKGCMTLDMSRVEISSWSIAWQRVTRTDCPHSQPTWYGHRSM